MKTIGLSTYAVFVLVLVGIVEQAGLMFGAHDGAVAGEQRHSGVELAVVGLVCVAVLAAFSLALAGRSIASAFHAVELPRWAIAAMLWALLAIPGCVIYYQQRLTLLESTRAQADPATSGSWAQAGGLFLILLAPVIAILAAGRGRRSLAWVVAVALSAAAYLTQLIVYAHFHYL